MMRRLVILILVGFLAASCASAPAGPEQKVEDARARAFLQLGASYLAQGQSTAASVRELLKAEALEPDNAAIQNHLGLAYMFKKKYEDSERHFQRALSLREKYSEAHNNLGTLYLDMCRFDEGRQGIPDGPGRRAV